MSNWDVSFFDGKSDFNFNTGSKVDTSAGVSHRSGEGWSTSANVEVLNIGAEMNAHTVRAETKYGGGIGKVALEGPNAGFDIGIRSNVENSGISAMAELSAAKAEATLGPAYVSANLNANTGLKAGSQGVQANFLGFGLTLGVGGRWTFDTPVGSLGASTANVLVHKREEALLNG